MTPPGSMTYLLTSPPINPCCTRNAEEEKGCAYTRCLCTHQEARGRTARWSYG